MLMHAVSAALQEDHLIDAGLLIDAQLLGDLLGCADAARGRHVGLVLAGDQEALVDVAAARPMIAVKIIMAKSIAEEIEAFRSARLGRRLIVSDREAGDHRSEESRVGKEWVRKC